MFSDEECATDHCSKNITYHVFCTGCGLPNHDYIHGHRPPALERQTHVNCAACGANCSDYGHRFCRFCGTGYGTDEVVFIGVVPHARG